MSGRAKRRALIGLFLAVFLAFSGLKVNLMIRDSRFRDYNSNSILRIKNKIDYSSSYSFILVGEVRNSIDIFDRRLIPLIHDAEADFVVFLGDSLIDGRDDKYGIFYRTLQKLNKPALVTIGDTEVSDGGEENFFKHLGPNTFFFITESSEFIFMDTTGKTSEKGQVSWLNDLLTGTRPMEHRFVFMNRSPFLERGRHISLENRYKMSEEYKGYLRTLFASTGVSWVFSSADGFFDQRTVDGVNYLATGGGGGALREHHPHGYFHAIKVDVEGSEVAFSILRPEEAFQSSGFTFMEYLWFRLLSLVYVHYINVMITLSLLFLVVLHLYTRLSRRIDFYPDLHAEIERTRPLKIVMFTNNYLPFIGGVPLSILRLKEGLEAKGHRVYLFAPGYRRQEQIEDPPGVFRCAPLFFYKKKELIIPVSNIFSSDIRRKFKRIDPDVVHVHHPYWLGGVGRRLARRYGKPVLFTYHTRIEHYNHNVPVFHDLAGGLIPHLLIKKFSGACDAVVAPTNSAKRYLRNLGVGKLILVQATGIDPDLYSREKGDPRRFAELRKSLAPANTMLLFSVFRLSLEKNAYFMLDGLRRLSARSSVPFVCYIAGTGPEEQGMRDYIEKHGMKERVVLLGPVDPEKITLYYQAADLFIFSSMSETQGMVILEAMAAGCPVVTVDSSGISDIVTDDVNGYKTKPELDRWVEKIEVLLGDRALRQRLSAGAIETAGKNSISAMTENILNLYYEIIDWRKKHPEQPFMG